MSTIPTSLIPHAHQRAAQRGIPPLILELLDDFGHERFARAGRTSHYLDQKGRQRLEQYLGHDVFVLLQPWLDVYMICDDGQVITVCHRQ